MLPGYIPGMINLFNRYFLRAEYVLDTIVLDTWKNLVKIDDKPFKFYSYE